MPPGPFKLKRKLLDRCPTIRHTNLHSENNIHACSSSATSCRELQCRCSCNIFAFCPIGTATSATAVQTCLLVEYCCKMDACWTVVTQSACLPIFSIQSCMSAGVVLLYLPHLLVWFLTISRTCWCDHAFWCGASLSAMTAFAEPQYRSCLLVWCLTISHASWCGDSL